MRNALKIFVASIAIAASAPAVAQYTFTQPGQPPQPAQQLQVWNNVARVNLGVGFYNSGWYNCYYNYYGTACTSGSYNDYVPFVVGPQIDFALGGMSNLSLGVTFATGTVNTSQTCPGGNCPSSTSATFWEPTLDYVAKFGPPTQDTVGRFRIGGGLIVAPGGNVGGAFRIGGGASFFNSNRFGIGLDLVVEGGSLNGQWIGGLQLLASPEFHF